MVGSGGAGSTGIYSRNTSSMSQAAAGAESPAGHRRGPTLATATSPRRAELVWGQPGTYRRFGWLVPLQLQANAVTGVPLLLLHVLQVPQVTVCTGETEGEGSRKAELDTSAVPSGDLPPWPFPGKVLGDGSHW